MRPTQRAPDVGYAPRFSGSFLGFELIPVKQRCLVPPQAGNAHRWALQSIK